MTMMTVKEVSRCTGVSVRALRYYDKIGLLKPDAFSEAGYRLYADAALQRLQKILLFRELQFSLKDIAFMLDHPADQAIEAALESQIRILRMKQHRLGQVINLALEYREKGEMTMDFTAFDTSKIKEYENEARQRWGHTPAFKEWEKAQSNGADDFTPQSYAAQAAQMEKFFKAFGELMDKTPGDPQVQALVREYQTYITDNYYDCTDEILVSLADMYVQDERFTQNMDLAGGKGCAAFVSAAIKACFQK